MRISVNGAEIARGDFAMRPAVMAELDETFDIGRDTNERVSDEYQNDGEFSGEIRKVTVDVKPSSTFAPSKTEDPD